MSCLKPSPPVCGTNCGCPDHFGCPPCVCPDFQIKRHDTRPPFKVPITDENGDPMDLTGLVVEASMWAKAKLKTAITDVDTSLSLADNIGFDQILVDDIIVTCRARSPEYMLVTGFDETNKTVTVQRGYQGTTADSWKKGTGLNIFRFMGAPAAAEMVYEDVTNVDGTVTKDVLQDSFLMYEWKPNDTCAPGCFWFEFKLLKLLDDPPTPSVTTVCDMGEGVEWVRRYPVCGEYLIKICDSPTAEAAV